MGMIRGGALVVVSVLFLVSILSLNVFWTMSNSLKFDNIKTELIPVVMNFADSQMNLSQVIDVSYPLMQTYCLNNSDFTMGEGGMTFVITCDTVKLGKEAVVNGMIDSAVNSIYYKEYDCGFFDCFKKYGETPFFLVSEHTHDYFNSKFYLIAFLSVVLLGLMFLFAENRSNAFIISGALVILAGLPFAKLNWILSFFAQKEYLQFFTFMFTQAFSVFIKCLILGIVLIVFGILWKIFSVGMKISEFFNKDKKEEKKKGK